MPAAPAPLQTSLVDLDIALGKVERIEQPGRRNDCGSMLVVMKYRECRAVRAASAR